MYRIVLLISLLLGSTTAVAQNAASLIQRDCMSCHGNEVYSRENRMVNSLSGLRHQIGRCHQATGKNWSPDQVEAVVQYLNENYYKF